MRGAYQEAVAWHQEALRVAREIADHEQERHVLSDLDRVLGRVNERDER
jgi:hypothetical protein